MKTRGQWFKNIALCFSLVAVLLGGINSSVPHSYAAQFSQRWVKLSNDQADEANAQYEIGLSGSSAGNVGSIRMQVCANDPFPGLPCTPVAGFDISQAQLASQFGMTGFSIHPSTTANELILSRVSAPSNAGVARYTLTGVHNPSVVGTAYVRLETFASTDATGANHDAAGLAFAILPSEVTIRSTVPPYLSFCVGVTIQPYDCKTASGSYVDFGTLSPTRTATGETKLLISTNAEFGYSIRVVGTTLTSGINIISALSSPDTSRQGKSQFGLNLRANSTPQAGQDPSGSGLGSPTNGYNAPNMFKFVSGDVLASYQQPDNFRMFTASYIVNIDKQQSPGVYVTTLTYIALASF